MSGSETRQAVGRTLAALCALKSLQNFTHYEIAYHIERFELVFLGGGLGVFVWAAQRY